MRGLIKCDNCGKVFLYDDMAINTVSFTRRDENGVDAYEDDYIFPKTEFDLCPECVERFINDITLGRNLLYDNVNTKKE